jgi:hypothetical protein
MALLMLHASASWDSGENKWSPLKEGAAGLPKDLPWNILERGAEF